MAEPIHPIDKAMMAYRARMTGNQPTMRFDPSGTATPLRERVPWADRVTALANWMGLALPGRGGLYVGRVGGRPTPEVVKGIGEAGGGSTESFHQMPSKMMGILRRAAREEGEAVPFDLRQAQPVFSEVGQFAVPTTYPQGQTSRLFAAHAQIPGAGRVRLGEAKVYPGATSIEMSPGVTLHPRESALLRDQFQQWLLDKGIIPPPMQTMYPAEERLAQFGMGWRGPSEKAQKMAAARQKRIEEGRSYRNLRSWRREGGAEIPPLSRVKKQEP
jgi:hypothetical protein